MRSKARVLRVAEGARGHFNRSRPVRRCPRYAGAEEFGCKNQIVHQVPTHASRASAKKEIVCISVYTHNIYISVYVHKCSFNSLYIYICMQSCLYTCLYIHTCTHNAHTYTYIHTCMHAYIHTYIYVCVYAYMHMHIDVQIYTYKHTHTHIYIYTDTLVRAHKYR